MRLTVFIQPKKCGVDLPVMGFCNINEEHIFQHLARIENLFVTMRDRNEWDSYKILHTCNDGENCKKFKGVELYPSLPNPQAAEVVKR